MNNKKWIDLNIKEKLAIITACAAFALGWAMSIASFLVPPLGVVSDGVLWILGQSLIYSASVFGITAYFRSETLQLKRDVDRHLEHMERMQMQRERIRKGVDIPELPLDREEYEE